jgi:hypothetical protein
MANARISISVVYGLILQLYFIIDAESEVANKYLKILKPVMRKFHLTYL